MYMNTKQFQALSFVLLIAHTTEKKSSTCKKYKKNVIKLLRSIFSVYIMTRLSLNNIGFILFELYVYKHMAHFE